MKYDIPVILLIFGVAAGLFAYVVTGNPRTGAAVVCANWAGVSIGLLIAWIVRESR